MTRALRRLFWDDYLGMISLAGLLISLLSLVVIIMGAVGLGWYLTSYQADLANCRAAGGHYVGGPLGDCVYPHGDTTRVHVDGSK